MDKKPDGFFEITDSAMIARLLSICHRYKFPFTIWTKNQTTRFDTKIAQYLQHLKTLTVVIPETPEGKAFRAALPTLEPPEVRGSFQIDTVHFFFKTLVYRDLRYGQLALEIPLQVFKLQRRANVRIPFKRQEAPKISLLDPDDTKDPDKPITEANPIHVRMLDLSEGGLAFAAPMELKSKFNFNTFIYRMTFTIRGTEIVVDGVVRHTRETTNDQGKPCIKVGIQFHALRREFALLLAKFALEESRQLFTMLY